MSSELDATLHLIRQAQGGDNSALGQIFSRYYERVRACVRRSLGKRLRMSVDSGDIMQETFLVAVEQFDNFEVRHDAGIIHWLSKIAENRVRDQARYIHAQRRDQRREQALCYLQDSMDSGAMQLEPAAEITLPGDAAAKKELNDSLSRALDELDPTNLEVIMHRTYGKAKWVEVAELMNLGSESAARQLHARALLQLAAVMKSSS